SPPPPPSTNFDTAEFRRSDGPSFHNAISAWQNGIVGTGSTIAIIDTGIDTDSPEFLGRIHPDSRDVAGNTSVEAVDDHGTHVALVAAAARDNSGVVGIAYGASVLALRADRPNTCNAASNAALDGCEFFDRDIAAGVNQAIASGAKVINLSLGGSAPTAQLSNAIAQAAAAGIVIVVSAGNDGDTTDPAINPNRPDPFAVGLLAAGGANVIIVGSVDENGAFSDFSNRAGDLSASFLTARGEAICCVYENGSLKVETGAAGSFVTLFSGTSFAAPQVAGAVALLAQAFPNLTGAQIVEILLSSAREAGAAGTDAQFGRGILDIAASLQPSGTTTLAGTTISLAMGDDVGVLSAPMGDALVNAPLQSVITDKYGRAYNYELGGRIREASIRPRLLGAIEQQGRRMAGSNGRMAMAFTVGNSASDAFASPLRLTSDEAQQAKVLAARIALKLTPETDFAFGIAESADGLVGQLQGFDRPAFLIAPGAGGDTGFYQSNSASLALRRQIGDWGVSFAAQSGGAWLGALRQTEGNLSRRREQGTTNTMSLSVDRAVGAFSMAGGASWLQERDTILGAMFHDSFGTSGAETLFIDAAVNTRIANDWRLGGAFRQGFTRARRSGLVAAGSNFQSRAWSLDLSRSNAFKRGDSFGLRMSQPLKIENGGLIFLLPTSYDYATETAVLTENRVLLAPKGRELLGELAWTGTLWGGNAAASLFYRRQPGHLTAAPSEAGAAVKWSKGL
ncbi:MAG: S8 family peptidase, partial [Pontixanthobacter sp.]